MYVKAVFRGGHVGTGRYHEMTRYMIVRNLVEVLDIAKRMPRVKKNHLAVISCKPISKQEYRRGKKAEKLDPYLNTRKNKRKG